jgi:hypothetical protein
MTFPIHEVSDVELVFPANVLPYMPKWEDIPDEFKDGSTKEEQLFNDWFYAGLKELELTPKIGIDKNKAIRHIKFIMGSFEPKHEHKTAAVAFLLREWFDEIKWGRCE